MLELRGRPVSPGLARGKAYVIGGGRVAVPRYRIAALVTGEERRRLESALQRGAEDLVRLQERVQAELGRPEAEIFDAHVALLKDEQFRERICTYIDRQQVNAEWAVETTVKDIAASLESADNEYLRERAADVRDLGHRVLRHLSDDERRPFAYLPADSILVARELFPLDLIEIDRAHLSAIVTERGGATGHAAILARALAIPAITGVGDAITVIPRAIKLVAEAGEKAGKAIAVCGEAAANPAVAGLLIGLGIRQLSMSPVASAWVRQRIRTLDSREAETLAVRALKRTDAELVRMAIWN
jgi:phosphotransferase system enzyme I (PtsI)